MLDILTTALANFGIYSLFVLLYTLVGAYQNINIWGGKWDWRLWLNGLAKWAALGLVVVGAVVGAFLLIEQANRNGIELVNVQAIAPKAIIAVVVLASGAMLVKIIAKLATTLGLSKEDLERLQTVAVNTDPEKTLVLDLKSIPMPSKEYIEAKLRDEEIGGVGAFYSVPTDSYESFKRAVNGNGYDIDNHFGWQCWDGAALLWQQFGKTLHTGNGLAIGCWDLKRAANQYDLFDLVTNVNGLKAGDVVVMRPNHIGFFDGYEGNNMRILGQNQGGRANPAGGSAFNLTLVAKSAFAGAFRLKKWNIAPTPTPTPTPQPSKTAQQIADEIWAGVGRWGNDPERAAKIRAAGVNPADVQAILNAKTKNPAPAPTPAPATFTIGDVVVPTRRISYDGEALTQWDDNYVISEVAGDRAVLTARGQVWAAMNTRDIRKA